MKLCICFFGVISRSIDKTIDSIRENILDEITRHHHEYHVYVHNMKIDDFVSTRAKDSQKIIDKCHLLPCDFFSETIQEDFNRGFPWKDYGKYGYQENNYNTFQNSLRQLYSVKKVTEMWKQSTITYDYFIYLRPDLEYTNKLDLKTIEEYHDKKILLTPEWGKYLGGLNDRIYMGPEEVIVRFGFRLDYVLDIINSKKIKYHPELFMKLVSEKFSIKTKDIDLRGRRIRANGIAKKEHHELTTKNENHKL